MKISIIIDVNKALEVNIKETKTIADLKSEVNRLCQSKKLGTQVLGLRVENDALLNDEDIIGKKLQKSQRLIAILPL